MLLQALYLMPSSSARCAQFPRAQDKVHFYIKLRELRDQLKGVERRPEIEEVAYSFDLGLAKGELSYPGTLLEFVASLKSSYNLVVISNRGCQEDGHKGGTV